MKRLSMLLAALALLCAAVAGPAMALEVTPVTASGTAGNVALDVSTDEPTAAGEIRVTYDSELLTYVSTDCRTEMYSVHAETGSVLVVYSSLEEMDGTLAVFNFSYTGTGRRETTVTVESTSYGHTDEGETVSEKVTLTLGATSGGTGGGGGGGFGGGGSGGGTTAPTQPAQPGQTEHVCISENYRDLDTKAWYHEAVDYVLEHGLMDGTGKNTFEPEAVATRAMFVTVLGRMTGIDATGYPQTEFSDVKAGSWYAPYVQWAYKTGVTTGVTEDRFEPERPMTRQEMVTFLTRYAKIVGVDVTQGAVSSLESFPDGDSVDSWAREAFNWAVGNGIVNGTGLGLEPGLKCSRAQVAKVIMKYDSDIAGAEE